MTLFHVLYCDSNFNSVHFAHFRISNSYILLQKYNFKCIKSKRVSLLQDGSTNSSPVFSSADNSFDKSKLVVRDLFSILQNFKCYPIAIGLNSNIFFKEHKIPIFKYHWILLQDRPVCDGIPCSLTLTEHQPVQSGRQL